MQDNLQSYIQLADRTSAPIAEPQERLSKDLTAASLRDLLNKVMALGYGADQFKRHIYYGKGLITPPESYVIESTSIDILTSPQMVELLHAGIGMLTEACEFLESLQGVIFNNKRLDETHLKEEVGDTFWYLAKACLAMGTTFEAEQVRNIAKLRKRYPAKFTEGEAIQRDLDQERAVLEQEAAAKALPPLVTYPLHEGGESLP